MTVIFCLIPLLLNNFCDINFICDTLLGAARGGKCYSSFTIHWFVDISVMLFPHWMTHMLNEHASPKTCPCYCSPQWNLMPLHRKMWKMLISVWILGKFCALWTRVLAITQCMFFQKAVVYHVWLLFFTLLICWVCTLHLSCEPKLELRNGNF